MTVLGESNPPSPNILPWESSAGHVVEHRRLAVQGDFAEHCHVLRSIGADATEVRLPEHLRGLDGLIIPGGESNTLSRLMSLYNLREPVADMAASGKAVWGTCAGMIMLAAEITEEDPVPLAVMDVGVQRNAFGRQVDSFEQDLTIKGLGSDPYHAIFIRAPVILRVGEEVGRSVVSVRWPASGGAAEKPAGNRVSSRTYCRRADTPLLRRNGRRAGV